MRKNRFFHQLAEKTGTNLEPEYWIFVVGCYNSGTSLLANLLAEHPNCSGLSNEGVVLTDKLSRPEDYGMAENVEACLKSIELDPHSVSAASTALAIKKQWSYSLTELRQY